MDFPDYSLEANYHWSMRSVINLKSYVKHNNNEHGMRDMWGLPARRHANVHFPSLSSNIPESPAYGIFVSQLKHCARVCSK